MKNKARRFLLFSTVISLLTATCWAEQQVSAGIALQDVDGHEDPGGSLIVNYAAYITPSLAIQGGITNTVMYAEQEIFNNSGNSVGFSEFYALTTGAYALYRHRIGDRLFFLGRGGVLMLFSESEDCIVGECEVAENDPEVSLSYGAGVGFQLSQAFDVQVQATQLHADVLHAGMTVGWSF